MKYIKILMVVLILITISACGGIKTTKQYEKMEIKEDGVTGYNLDLRIYGLVNNESVNKILRIRNYMNKSYEIMIPSIKEDEEEKIIYVIDNKTYIENEEGKYVVTDEKIKYTNPAIYLEGLNYIKKDAKPKEEKVGEITYDVYEVMVDKKTISNILKDTDIKNIKIDKDINAKIYLNKEGYVYRIIYYLDGLTINANYFGINTVGEIELPVE